ncbi:hypothetical protein R3P38DRAFT_2826047 [Favolaschia claudopus]|uniref:Uncharacterized protein n=1 Tax=Favolaschia claudopus TaxID=2862362 RepID=A0AAW0EIB2_9AGAR
MPKPLPVLSNLITFTSARLGALSVFHQNVSGIFAALSSTEQRDFVDKLFAFRAKLDTQGDDVEFLRSLNLLKPVPTPSDVPRAKAALIDSSNWHLSMCLRYSTPTRIAEAVPYLEQVIAGHKRNHPDGEVDVTPEMYLGVALHEQPGQEEAAIAHFRAAYDAAPDIGDQCNTQIWSRACYSRLLHRLGREKEALEQDDEVCSWIVTHPFAMTPSEFRNLVADPKHEGKNPILETPDMKEYFGNMMELGPGMVIHFG